MDPDKIAVRQIIDQLSLAGHCQALGKAVQFAGERQSSENLRRLRDRLKDAKAACGAADAVKQASTWSEATRAYFNAAVTPLWHLIETGRQILQQNGDEDVISPPRALTPRPHTRHRTPSFSLVSIDAGGAAYSSGAHDSANFDADGAALVPGANGGDPKDHDAVNIGDSASNVSSTTSSVRRRKNALADRVKKEAIQEKHRLEMEKEALEERERKLEEEKEKEKWEITRKKNDLRRKAEMAQCELDVRVSTIEAAEEDEMEEIEKEARKRERSENEGNESNGVDYSGSSAAFYLPPSSLATSVSTTVIPPLSTAIFLPPQPSSLPSSVFVSSNSSCLNPSHPPISSNSLVSSSSLSTFSSSHLISSTTDFKPRPSCPPWATSAFTPRISTTLSSSATAPHFPPAPAAAAPQFPAAMAASFRPPAPPPPRRPPPPPPPPIDGAAAAISATNAFIATQQLALLRPSEKDKWGGDSKEENVRVFLRRFETDVEAIAGLSDRQKYEELKAWTRGNAHTYVKAVKDRPPSEALLMAKQRLIMFFAAIPRTAIEIFDPIKKGKAISQNDKDGYQLLFCELESLESSCLINNDSHLLDMIEMIVDVVALRMPKLQNDFSNYAGRVYQAGHTITFQTLKSFLCDRIHQLSLPCSSMAFEKRQQELKGGANQPAKKPPDQKPKVKTESRASIAAAETGNSAPSTSSTPPSTAAARQNEAEATGKKTGRAACAKCEKLHNLFDCPEFKALSPLERRKFNYSAKVCFRCNNSRTHVAPKCTMTQMQCHCGSTGHHRLTHLTEEEEKEFAAFVQKQKEERQKEKARKEQEKETAVKGEKKVAAACAETAAASDDEEAPSENRVFNAFVRAGSKITFRPVVPLILSNPANGKSRKALAILDNGSDTSCVIRKTAEEMDFASQRHAIEMSTVSQKGEKKSRDLCQVELKSLYDEDCAVATKAIVIDHIPMDVDLVPKKVDLLQYPHLKDLDLQELSPLPPEVEVLIGADLASTMAPIDGTMRRSTLDNPIGYVTAWGPVIVGPTNHDARVNKFSSAFISFDNDCLNKQMNEVFSERPPDSSHFHLGLQSPTGGIEGQRPHCWRPDPSITQPLSHGVQGPHCLRPCPSKQALPENAKHSIDDLRAFEIMQDTVKHVGDKYQVGALWNKPRDQVTEEMKKIPSLATAHRRLLRLGQKLGNDPDEWAMVKKHVHTLVDKGYAEKVDDYPPTKPIPDDQPCFYIPLLPTQDKRKPEKRRITHDCAAKTSKKCLNDYFFKGPDLANSLALILLRFRENPWALMADIGDYFMRVGLPEEDLNAFRFLFFREDPGSPVEILRMIVHLFGAKSSTSVAAFALRQCALDNAKTATELAIWTIFNHFYIDDMLQSVEDEDQGIQLIEELTTILAKGGFHLTKWVSNSKKILEAIPEDKLAKSVKSFREWHENDGRPEQHALGMKYDVEKDEFSVEVAEKYLQHQPINRRQVLGLVHSIYDPLGLYCPNTLVAKRELQKFGQMKLGWDDPIPQECLKDFENWRQSVPTLLKMKVPRWIGSHCLGNGTKRQFHLFCDASILGIAASCYARFIDDLNQTHVSLVTAKSHVIPSNDKTSCLHGSIPRAELEGACKARNLALTVSEAYDVAIHDFVFWTDSSSVIRQIVNPALKLETFVRNRVVKILDVTLPTQWRYVPTHLNPADAASRGIDAKDEKKWREFHEGPSFLHLPPEEWPVCPFGLETEEVAEEVAEVAVAAAEISSPKSDFIHEMARYASSWDKLVFRVVILSKFCSFLKTKKQTKASKEKPKAGMTASEYRRASLIIIASIQQRHFPDEIHALKDGKSVVKKSRISQLSPFLEEENGVFLLRVGGRLHRRPDGSKNSNHPIILPRHDVITPLIIQQYHSINGHVSTEHCRAILRQKYWILQDGVAVRGALRKCLPCRRRNGATLDQKMAPLPDFRLSSSHPWETTGVDFCGHFHVKSGRSRPKRWVCLFTCAVTRAIHCEVTDSLDITSFINALQRFNSRRPGLRRLVSDNGTNFRGAERELKEETNAWMEKVNNQFSSRGIEWIFSPPSAPFVGGFFERMVKAFKKVFYSLLDKHEVGADAFHTLVVVAEGIVNSRPLSSVSSDPEDFDVLTPNSLLHPMTTTTTTTTLPPSSESPPTILLHRWRHVRSLADGFWKRFKKEYTSTLQQRRKWTSARRNVSIGDVVLIAENSPRDEWGIARVIETFPDREGLVRRVRLKTTKRKELERHINSLVLLEAVDEKLAPGGIDPATSASINCFSFSPSEIYVIDEARRIDSRLKQ